MDISVLLPSRGRPEKCLRAIKSLRPFGPHVEIVVGLDEDDPTAEQVKRDVADMIGVRAVIAPRHQTLARLCNSLYEISKGKWIFIFPDDYVMVTKGWPGKLLHATEQLPNGIGVPYLRDVSHPQFATCPVLSRKMIEAAKAIMPGGYQPPWFPYWYSDTWWDEIGDMLGVKPELDIDVHLPDGRGSTQNLRDVTFWAELFHASRPMRGQIARALVEMAFGRDIETRNKCLARFPQLGNQLFQKTQHLLTPDFAKAFEGNIDGAPSPRYAEAKAEAEKFRATMPQGARQIRVGVCIPTTGTIHARTATALMSLCAAAAQSGIALMTLTLEGSMVTKNRNDCVDIALKNECDFVLWIDSDMIFPPDALMRLMSHGKDIVGATYCKRVPPYETLGRLLGPKPTDEEFAKGGLREAELLPGGIMLIRTDVFKKIPRLWYWETYRWQGATGTECLKSYILNNFVSQPSAEVLASLDATPLGAWLDENWKVEAPFDHEYFSEDLNFCRKAKRAGYKIWCDLSLTFETKHIGVIEVTTKAPGTPNRTAEEIALQAKVSSSVSAASNGAIRSLSDTTMPLPSTKSGHMEIFDPSKLSNMDTALVEASSK